MEQVECLISAGAKCTENQSTKCTPLYAAIRGGHIQIVKNLLAHFPEAMNVKSHFHIFKITFNLTFDLFSKVMTSENWSPLHVACINGKNDVVDLLLGYKFPRELLQKYR